MFSQPPNIRKIYYIRFGGSGDRIDSNRGPANCVCTFPMRESRLFYLVYVLVELVEELVVEIDMEIGSRVNPE